MFAGPTDVAGTGADNDDGDLLDYDADGDLDVYVAGFSGQDLLLRNDTLEPGPLAFAVVPGATSGPAGTSLDVDAADVDGDGDHDVLLGNQQANVLMLNVGDVADEVAPRIPLVEEPPDSSGGGATRIRAHVYDNAPDYLTACNATELSYSVNGGPFQSAPMRWVGAQVFHNVAGPAGSSRSTRVRAELSVARPPWVSQGVVSVVGLVTLCSTKTGEPKE